MAAEIAESGPTPETLVKNEARVRAEIGSVGLMAIVDGEAIIEEPNWQERALCRQTDPEAFFPEKGGSTREAKRVCLSCDVRGECLEYALQNDERHGIWGGLSERERRKIKSKSNPNAASVGSRTQKPHHISGGVWWMTAKQIKVANALYTPEGLERATPEEAARALGMTVHTLLAIRGRSLGSFTDDEPTVEKRGGNRHPTTPYRMGEDTWMLTEGQYRVMSRLYDTNGLQVQTPIEAARELGMMSKSVLHTRQAVLGRFTAL